MIEAPVSHDLPPLPQAGALYVALYAAFSAGGPVGLLTVTVTVAEVPILLAASYALLINVWEPFVVVVVFQLML
jgi:hypothetical protein